VTDLIWFIGFYSSLVILVGILGVIVYHL